MFLNKLFTNSRAHISKCKRCLNVKSSTYHFHLKTKILADFQICISVPLICFTLACWIHGNPIVIHVLEVNPVDYVISSIIRAGQRGAEITISFAKLIHRKISHYHNFLIYCWKFFCSNKSKTYRDFRSLTV